MKRDKTTKHPSTTIDVLIFSTQTSRLHERKKKSDAAPSNIEVYQILLEVLSGFFFILFITCYKSHTYKRKQRSQIPSAFTLLIKSQTQIRHTN